MSIIDELADRRAVLARQEIEARAEAVALHGPWVAALSRADELRYAVDKYARAIEELRGLSPEAKQ